MANFVLCFYFLILTKRSWVRKREVNHMMRNTLGAEGGKSYFQDFVRRPNSVIDVGLCITGLMLELLQNPTRNCIPGNNGIPCEVTPP